MGVAILSSVGLALATNPRIRGWFSTLGTADGPTLDRWFMLRLGGIFCAIAPWWGLALG